MSDEIKALRAELVDLAAGMKQQQIDFAQGLIDGKTQEKAYIDADLKGKNPNSDASNYLNRNASICKYVELTKKILALEVLPAQVATFEQKRQMLNEVAQRCLQNIEPKFVGAGEDRELVGYVFDSRGVIGAIAELNKMDGDLATIKIDSKNHISYEDLTEEQLNAI